MDLRFSLILFLSTLVLLGQGSFSSAEQREADPDFIHVSHLKNWCSKEDASSQFCKKPAYYTEIFPSVVHLEVKLLKSNHECVPGHSEHYCRDIMMFQVLQNLEGNYPASVVYAVDYNPPEQRRLFEMGKIYHENFGRNDYPVHRLRKDTREDNQKGWYFIPTYSVIHGEDEAK